MNAARRFKPCDPVFIVHLMEMVVMNIRVLEIVQCRTRLGERYHASPNTDSSKSPPFQKKQSLLFRMFFYVQRGMIHASLITADSVASPVSCQSQPNDVTRLA